MELYNRRFLKFLGRSLIVEMIYRRTTDEKVAVRKAGLQALEAIVQMDATSIRTSVSHFKV